VREIKIKVRELVEHKRKAQGEEAKRTQVEAQVDEISGSIYAPGQNEPGAYSPARALPSASLWFGALATPVLVVRVIISHKLFHRGGVTGYGTT
jgi:hypothetical protein